jgi:hypothetical protein
VSQEEKLANPARPRAWTRADDYLGAMARKRMFRRAHADKPRTQPEKPQLLLSTVPFLLLIGLLAVLSVAIMIIAFPGNQPQAKPRPAVSPEPGVAPKGWFQEAQKEMHR